MKDSVGIPSPSMDQLLNGQLAEQPAILDNFTGAANTTSSSIGVEVGVVGTPES